MSIGYIVRTCGGGVFGSFDDFCVHGWCELRGKCVVGGEGVEFVYDVSVFLSLWKRANVSVVFVKVVSLFFGCVDLLCVVCEDGFVSAGGVSVFV